MRKIVIIYATLLLSLSTLWATPNTLYFMEFLPYQQTFNPAMQPRCTTYVELPAISTISVAANTGGITLNDLLYVKDGKLVTFLHPEYGNKDAVFNKLSKSKGFDFETDISLFGFGFRVKEKGYVNINASVRANAMVGYPSELISLGLYGTPDTLGINNYSINTPLSVNAYIDLNGGYSHKINDKWTVGGKLHLLVGAANAQFNTEGLGLDASQEYWRLYGNANGKFSIPGITVEMDENGEIVFNQDLSNISINNFGAAIDLGAEFKPIPDLKISFALNNIGFMVWNTNSTYINGDIDYTFNGIAYDGDNMSNVGDSILNSFNESTNIAIGEAGPYATMLNGRFYAGVEYSFLKNMMSVGLMSKTSFNYKKCNEELTLAYNIRPCYWVGISASYSFVSAGWSTMGLAFNFRLPPLSFYVASDYTPFHYSSEGIPYKTSALNVQAGLVLTFGCKNKKVVNPEEEVVPVGEVIEGEQTDL